MLLKRLWMYLLLPFFALAQTPPACNPSGTMWKGTFTTAAAGTSNPNNTANPTCNAFALTWNTGSPTSGITALSIQLEGSDDNTTFTAFTGSTVVVVGPNPSTEISGAIIIQANAHIAYVRARVNSLSGSGVINYQIYGYNGISPAARGGGGGGGGGGGVITQPWTAGTNITAGQLICVSQPPTNPAVAITCPITVVGFHQIAITILGVAQNTVSAGGTVNVIVQGPATCTFDSINPVVAGDTVNISLTTPGTCQDAGDQTSRFGTPYVGVATTSGSVSTTQSIYVYGMGLMGSNLSLVPPMQWTNPGGLQPENFQIKAGNATSGQGTGTKLQFSTGTAVNGDVVIFDATGNTIDSGKTLGNGYPYVASASGSSFSVPVATANQGLSPVINCWSGPVVVVGGKNVASGSGVVCTPTNDGGTNVGATYTAGTVQSVVISGLGATTTAASGLTGGCTSIIGAINGPCKVTISAAQLATLSSTTSVEVLPAVAGKSYFIQGAAGYFNFGTVLYTFTGSFWAWDIALPGVDVNTVNSLFVLANIMSPLLLDQYFQGIASPSAGSSPSYVGQAVNLYLQTDGGMTGGDGTLDIYLTYILI